MSCEWPLFDAFPGLADRLPRRILARLPSPVEPLTSLETDGGPALFIKRDDLCSDVYGGNKTRKLELILGKLEQSHHRRVITFGFAGSNHAAATAMFCEPMGVECVSMLMPQPVSLSVRRNLLLGHGAGARLILYPNLRRLILGAVVFRTVHRGRHGAIIPMISAGGTTPEGNTSFVNAAFELRDQVAAGLCPRPDSIYVAAGSLGTAAGLIAGLNAAGLKTQVVPVRVTDERFANRKALAREVSRTARFLRRRDPSFPAIDFGPDEIEMEHGYFGKQYGMFTAEGTAARETMRAATGIELDCTYSAKAFACFLDAAKAPQNRGKSLLFWNTANGTDLRERADGIDYRALPVDFHRYFTDEAQPLDVADEEHRR